MKSKLKFDELKHRYTYEGRRVISTTDTLALAGLCDYSMVKSQYLEPALRLGTDVAVATMLYDKRKSLGGLSYVSGQVEAWAAFKKEMDLEVIAREKTFYCSHLDYATKPDCIALSKFGRIVVQIKIGHVEPWVAIQTAAEEHASLCTGTDRTHPRASSDRRFGVQLNSDGTFKATRFNGPGFSNDLRIFISALNVAKWRVAHGAKF